LVSAGIGLVILVYILLSDKIYINIGVAAISIIALYELFSAVEGIKDTPLPWLGYIYAVFIAFGNYADPSLITISMYAFLFILFIALIIFHKNVSFIQVGLVFFFVVYICYFLSHIIYTRGLVFGNVLVWLIFAGAWMTDTFAYFVGINLGKHKLMPEISPKKTIEGAIGGILGCGLSFLLFGFVVSYFGKLGVNYYNLFILGILCAIISEVGDLAASSIKRHYEIKDFGNIMPGHGGVMDRFDSIIFVAPVVYYFSVNFILVF
jgi:phosphatidate cytidylyltransferase